LLAEAHISILNAKIYMLLHSKQLKINEISRQTNKMLHSSPQCNLNDLIIPM